MCNIIEVNMNNKNKLLEQNNKLIALENGLQVLEADIACFKQKLDKNACTTEDLQHFNQINNVIIPDLHRIIEDLKQDMQINQNTQNSNTDETILLNKKNIHAYKIIPPIKKLNPLDKSVCIPYQTNIFTNIIDKKTAPANSIVYEDDEFIVLNDIHPEAKTHLLILPKKHYSTLLDCVYHEGKSSTVLHRVTQIANTLCPKGFRLNIHIKENQHIFHLHFHVLSDIN